MDNETLFYIFGIGLAISSVVVTFLGLKVKGFPGKAFPLVVIWFVVFVIGSATFSVRHANDEHAAHAAADERAGEVYEAEGHDVEAEDSGSEGKAKGSGDEGGASAQGGETLQLAADPAALAYDTAELSASAGEITIDFSNPSAIEHDVAIEQDGEEIAATDVITESEATLTADLEAGSYTFLCTVPGHAEAGMEGTLTVR